MAMVEQAEVPVPKQHTEPEVVDFRNSAYGPKGYKERTKRKLDEYEEQVEHEALTLADMEQDGDDAVRIPLRKRVKHNVVGVGRASGRPWKQPGERAGTFKNPLLSTSWEQKMKLKAEKAAFKAARQEAVDAHKAKLAKVRKQREDARARKEENRRKSSVTEAVNTKTVQRMMKSRKQRRLLQKADTLKQ